MNSALRLSFLLLMIIVSISCNKDTGELSVVNLDGEFTLSVSQELLPTGPDFSLKVETTNIQECADAEIVYEVRSEESGVNVILQDISQIEDCNSGAGVARRYISINTDGQDTDLSISLRSAVKNIGVINITPNSYTLEMNTLDGIIISRDMIERIPEDLVIGYISGNDDSEIESVHNAIRSWEDAPLLDGDFGLFTIAFGNINFVDFEAPADTRPTYLRVHDWSNFTSSLESIRLAHPTLDIQMVDAFGNYL